MNILINYLYEYYPFTTASYFEKSIKQHPDCKCYRNNNFDPDKIDLVLNIEPVKNVIKIPGVPSVYYEIDNHVIAGNDTRFYDPADILILAQKTNLKYYEKYNPRILPLAAHPKCHKRYSDEPIKYDIGLLGNDTYPARRSLLESLGRHFRVLRGTAKPGEPYSRLLNQCQLTFNRSMADDVNMRFFEAIGCGRMLLTDYLPEQDNFATVGKHYITYDGEEDLIRKVKHYLKNEKEREKIAKRGAAHIHEHHNYYNRLKSLLNIVYEYKKS